MDDKLRNPSSYAEELLSGKKEAEPPGSNRPK